MTAEELIALAGQVQVEENRLTAAIKREWGDRGVDGREPYISNGASRAALAVLDVLRQIAATGEKTVERTKAPTARGGQAP